MGRSVSYPHGAIVAFTSTDDQDDYDDLLVDLQQYAPTLWHSLDECDKWIGREDRAVLRNEYAYVGISEYCGLVARWIVVRDDAARPGLAERWVAQVAPRFLKTFGDLQKIGTFSNGEAVFKRIAA